VELYGVSDDYGGVVALDFTPTEKDKRAI